MRMQHWFPLLVTLLCVADSAVQVQAYDTVEYSAFIPEIVGVDFSLSNSVFSFDPTTVWNSTLSFPRFDPALGTLAFVYINHAVNTSTQFTVLNNYQTGTAVGHISTEILTTLKTPKYNIIAASSAQSIPTTQIPFELEEGQGWPSPYPLYSLNYQSSRSLSGNSINNIVVLSEFTGTGNITISTLINARPYVIQSTGNVQAQHRTAAAIVRALVKYYYTKPVCP